MSAINWLVEKSEVDILDFEGCEGVIETHFQGKLPRRMVKELESVAKQHDAKYVDNMRSSGYRWEIGMMEYGYTVDSFGVVVFSTTDWSAVGGPGGN